ncbi:hypothetical protein KEJ19_03785 [Candidatus Bathyarchaeota archaeon]|nr:hypothetical protein [Candidatus Bathyarchaeota archaeon]
MDHDTDQVAILLHNRMGGKWRLQKLCFQYLRWDREFNEGCPEPRTIVLRLRIKAGFANRIASPQ